MSRRRWKQKKRPKWIDKDPRKQGWTLLELTIDSKTYINKSGKKFYVRW